MIRRTTTGVAALLVLFHAYLFVGQLWNGEFAEPALIFRWVVAAALLQTLLAGRKAHHSLIWGRKALCIWVLAALLHCPAPAGAADSQTVPTLPAAVTAVFEIVASLALGLALIFVAATTRRRLAVTWRLVVGRRAPAGPICVHHLRLITPRPPPLCASL